MKRIPFIVALAITLAAGVLTDNYQDLTGPPANPLLKYSTPMSPGIAVADKIETRLGTLNLFEG